MRSYAGVCLEGAIIALACIIFSAMASSPPAVDPNVSAVTAVWSYVGELIFNLLVLAGACGFCAVGRFLSLAMASFRDSQ